MESLRLQLETLQWQKAQIELEKRKLKDEKPERATEIAEFSKCKEKLKVFEEEIETINGQLQEMPELEKQLQQLLQDVDTLQGQLTTESHGESEDNLRLKRKLERLQGAYVQASANLEESESVNEKLQAEIASTKSSSETLQHKCEDLEQKCSEQERKIESTEHDLEFRQLKALEECNQKWEVRKERLLKQMRESKDVLGATRTKKPTRSTKEHEDSETLYKKTSKEGPTGTVKEADNPPPLLKPSKPSVSEPDLPSKTIDTTKELLSKAKEKMFTEANFSRIGPNNLK